MTTETSKNKLILKGRENYLEWSKRFEAMAIIEDWGDIENGVFISSSEEEEKEAKRWVIMNLSDEAIRPITPSAPLQNILEKLNEVFGYGNFHPTIQKQSILGFIEFPIVKDPTQVFLWLEKELDILRLCGGRVDNTFVSQVIDQGLQCTMNQNSVFIENTDFWAPIRGEINELEENEWDYVHVKKRIYKYWQAHRNKKIQVDSSPFEPKQKLAKALNVQESDKSSKKSCTHCAQHRRRIHKSHNSDKCFYGDVPGWKRVANAVEESTNKEDSDYVALFSRDSISKVTSKIFYDTGCTPVSYFRDMPSNFNTQSGWVTTASNEKIKSLGEGSVQIGKLKLDKIIYVPDFKYNLLSGIQLMNKGYTQIIENGVLKIYDQNKRYIAGGKYNPDYGLIEVIPDMSFLCLASKQLPSLEVWHQRLAHFNTKTILKNLKLKQIECQDDLKECSDCMKGKQNRHSAFKSEENKSYDILEMIESDTTPFPVTSYDGFSYNIKFVCRKTGYIHTEFIKDLKSATCLEAFKIFQVKYEKLTGKQIKYLRTDGGSEYKGVFSDYIISQGITKQPLTQKFQPARAERAHRTVLELARTCHTSSKLPLKYYTDAHRYVTHTINRIIRDGEEESPAEKMNLKDTNIKNFKSFGCICYIYQEKGKAVEGKLANSGIKCRFLGYRDETGKSMGYKVLREYDRKVLYSSAVIFPEETIESLENLAVDYDNFYILLQKQALNEVTGESLDNISDHEDEINDYQRINSNDENFAQLENAIDVGHVTLERGSHLVALARLTELSLKEVSHSELHKCFSTAMFEGCPKSYEEALRSENHKEWKDAMDAEMNQIKNCNTWDLKSKPNNIKPVKSKWVFTKKFDSKGNIKKYKARFVARGFTQKHGIDYVETFAPVVKFKSIRTLAAICAELKLTAYQDDVPSAFLKGNLKETVWMEQPEGYKSENPYEFCLLNKTLYGLKQSPREWNEVLHEYMISKGFIQSRADPCIYVNSEKYYKGMIIVGIYVDDINTIGSPSDVKPFRDDLREEFKIKEGGLLEWYLGIAFNQETKGTIYLDQTIYLKQKLTEFKDYIGKEKVSQPLPSNYQNLLLAAELEEPATEEFPYRQIVGSLMYAMLGTRPDLACAISVVSQFLEKPKPTHIKLVKQILKYLAGNLNLKLKYEASNGINLTGYVDASYGNETKYKSRSGYGFMLGGSLICWYSGKQKRKTAQSSCEAEYYAAVSAANEAIWIKQLLEDMGFPQKTITLYEDNQACIALTKNPEDHKRTKHIQIRYHVVQDYVKQGLVKFVYCSTKDQLADMFTKGVSGVQLRSMMRGFGIIDFKSQGEC
jgi:hypothetical protein